MKYDDALAMATDMAVEGVSKASTDVLRWQTVAKYLDVGKPVDGIVNIAETFDTEDPYDDPAMRIRIETSDDEAFSEILSYRSTRVVKKADLVKGAEFRAQLPRVHGRYVRMYFSLDLADPNYDGDADAWSDAAPYDAGDVVSHSGKIWYSLEDYNEDEPGGVEVDSWQEIGEDYNGFSEGKVHAYLGQGN